MAQAEGWLAILQAACAQRAGSEISMSVQLALYAGTLCEYPADVAKHACHQMARGSGPGVNWFPTLGELVAVCDDLAKERRLMGRDVHRVRSYAPKALPAPEPEPVQIDTEGPKRVRAMLAEYLEERKAIKASRPLRRAEHGQVDSTGITPELRAIIARPGFYSSSPA